jgi:DNA-binding NarL/FixJ family response regulator
VKPKRPTINSARKHRVLLVDDHAILREGFAELINSHPGLEVCGQAGTAARAIGAVERLKPDLVVVDLSLEGRSGLELVKDLKALHPKLPMLVLSMHEENLYAERALRAGALGYVMKREESRTVLNALETVLRGKVFLSREMSERLLHKVIGGNRQPNVADVGRLSDRELEVFQLIGAGRTTRQIAHELRLSISTVETHRAHIKEKLNLHNPAELMRAAVEQASGAAA